jgi:hypothetical protein
MKDNVTVATAQPGKSTPQGSAPFLKLETARITATKVPRTDLLRAQTAAMYSSTET